MEAGDSGSFRGAALEHICSSIRWDGNCESSGNLRFWPAMIPRKTPPPGGYSIAVSQVHSEDVLLCSYSLCMRVARRFFGFMLTTLCFPRMLVNLGGSSSQSRPHFCLEVCALYLGFSETSRRAKAHFLQWSLFPCW